MFYNKRILGILRKILLPVMVVFVIISSPALAATYSADVQLTESSGNDYAMYPALTYMNVSNLVSTSIIDADGLDTLIATSTSFPHMLSNNKLLFALPLGPFNTIPLTFTTSNTPKLDAFHIITGYSGNITVSDNASIELENNFAIFIQGWLDTTAGANKYMVWKNGAFELRVDATTTGTVNSTIVGQYTLSATGVSSGNQSIETGIDLRPDFDDWDNNCTVGMEYGSGIIPTVILQEVELTSAASSVNFSGISTLVSKWDNMAGVTSRHLVLVTNAASNDAVGSRVVYIRLNGDSGVNYNYQYIRGVNAAASAARDTSATYAWTNEIPGTTYSNSYGGGSTLIPAAFLTTNQKSLISYGGAVEYSVEAVAVRWADTDAINSALLYPDTGNFASGSTFQLAVVDERYLVEEDYNASADFLPDFNGIAGTGDDLIAIGYARTDRVATSDLFKHELNNDNVVANYNWQYLDGSGAGPPTSGANNNNDLGYVTGDSATANAFGAFVCSYSQYAEVANDPHIICLSGHHESSLPNSHVMASSARWNNVAAIIRIEYFPEFGVNFKAGSLFSLYRVPRYTIDRQELVASANITFSNIPQGYEALQLLQYARSDSAGADDFVNVQINSDAVLANYDVQNLSGVGGVVAAVRDSDNRTWATIAGGGAGVNEFGGGIWTFYQYGKTDRHKHIMSIDGNVENSIYLRSCRWENTDNISNIYLTPEAAGASFVAGSIFELVGLMPDKTFHLIIDDVVYAITAAANLSVPDNANPYYIGMNNVLPYMEKFEIWKEDEY